MIGCLGLETTSIPVERIRRPVGHSTYGTLERFRSAGRAFACMIDLKRSRLRGSEVWRQPEKHLEGRYGFRFRNSAAVPAREETSRVR
jgi:hypothetical protein